MRISVKVLNGPECSLVVSSSSEVREVKGLLHTLISIPTGDQELLYQGRSLLDHKLLKDYDIQDEASLTLVVTRRSSTRDVSSPLSPIQPAPESLPPVWENLRTFLKRHFAEGDAELVLEEFRKSFEQRLSQLSLDDIDRLAASKIRQLHQSH